MASISPDLPVEVWTSILDYLPTRIAWKLISLNRLFFEMGMDELYEEVRLMECDERSRKTFEQILHPNIGSRVRRLYIQPTFLPGIDEEGKEIPDGEQNMGREECAHFLEAAVAALASCSQLEEITVVLLDHFHTPQLLSFLGSLLSNLAGQLHVMKLDATPISFLSFLQVLPKDFRGLSLLSIRIRETRLESHEKCQKKVTMSLHGLITASDKTLRHLTLAHNVFDFSALFRRLPQLPLLQSFEYRANIPYQLSDPAQFVSFLQHNARNLESLRILPVKWHLNPSEISALLDQLFSLSFPHLRRLNMGVLDDGNHYKLLQRFVSASFAPNLDEVKFSGPYTMYNGSPTLPRQKSQWLQDISPPSLRLARFYIQAFMPVYIEYLCGVFPNLQSLEVQCDKITRPIDLSPQVGNYEQFMEYKYPSWGLKHLRISLKNHEDTCSNKDETNFDVRLIDAVAVGLPTLEHICRPDHCGSQCRFFVQS